jgi:hypothetical protein
MVRLLSDEMDGDEAIFLSSFLGAPKYEQTLAEIDHRRVPDDYYPLETLEAL